eukprot:TRINITY_DN23485_c0_g1_i1.p1 TRINITY_DN23485_c0_g1~~TRINITY_DN23485_c0_g1_i1.p1  ORF type:complete len:224 (+),score=22.82 TRINITY_DN23485_c0_g1_i1:177-848(+)
MANKTVLWVDMHCRKCKKIALHSVSKLEGIDKVEIDMKQKTMTVIGDADPACITNQLRKDFPCTRIISVGPASEKPPTAPSQKNASTDSKPNQSQKPTKSKKEPSPDAGKPLPSLEGVPATQAQMTEHKQGTDTKPQMTETISEPEEKAAMPTPVEPRVQDCCQSSIQEPRFNSISVSDPYVENNCIQEPPWLSYYRPFRKPEVWYVWKEENEEYPPSLCTIS